MPEKKWVNPKSLSPRERMDRYLEQHGLMNYQTKDLSPDEIAQRYAQAGVTIAKNSSWFKDNYGFEPPEILTNRQLMNDWRKNPTSLLPQATAPQDLRPDKSIQYTTADNGLVIKKKFTGEVAANPLASQSLFAKAKTGEINWSDLPTEERKKKLSDPKFYESGEITTYPTWMQQQILADPALDWNKLPKAQQAYYNLSSSPAAMGAVQGAVIGAANPLGGAALGAALGWAAGKSGYNPTKEAWQQDNPVSKAFGFLNWLAEQAEKTIGLGFQATQATVDPNKNVADVLNKESWNAGAVTFEVLTPAFIDVMNDGKGQVGWDDLLKLAPSLYVTAKIGDLILHPEKNKGQEVYLGAKSPIQLDKSWIERIDRAREEIKAGRPYREVMMDMQTGVTAQLGDMAGQAFADPLNYLPRIKTKIGAKIAEATGNKVAAQALRESAGLTEAGRRYKTLVQTGEALKIDPNFQVDQMGWLSRMAAGVNKEKSVKAGSLWPTEKGLLAPETEKSISPKFTKDPIGFLRSMAEQDPYSRAQTGAKLFYENIRTLLTIFDDPHEAGKYLKALANNDMDTWAELGTRFAESPEFYTVLPALKDFNANLLDGIVSQWDLSGTNRDVMTRIANLLGEEPAKWLEDTAKRGTFEQDFERLKKRVNTLVLDPSPEGRGGNAEAKAILADIEAGRITPEFLKQTVDLFTGEGALSWHPGQWKAMMMDSLGAHFDKWVTQRLMLDKSPDAVNAFYRTTALMKQAQSILLLGGSPGYAITNGLSNMVHRAVTGIYGYMTPKSINDFLDRMGVSPARMEEGVGIGGQVEQIAGRSQVKNEAMTKAVKGTGPLTTAKATLAKISRGMPMSKLSSWFESTEGRQGYAIAMKQFWSQSWRRGVGFERMRPELVSVITEMGINPDRIYAAIEAGMNQAEIEQALYGRQEGIQARSLVHDAAQKKGLSTSQAANMLEKIGYLDALDTFLKGQGTKGGVQAAFNRANRVAQDWIDMQTGEDLKATAEAVKQRVGLEGGASGLDVMQKAHGAYTDAWMDHYYRFGEVMSDLSLLDDPAQRSKAIDYNYELSDAEFRRVNARNAANYKGIFEAWGISGNKHAMNALAAIGESNAAMENAYRAMREIRKGFFDKYRNDFDNPGKWDEWDANNRRIDSIFKKAFAEKHNAEVKMGKSLTEIYEGMYGPAAGEAARLWWEDVTAFNDEIVKREQDFRKSIEGLVKEEREAAKNKYYSETKNLLIAELDKINGEGIARLERVIKGGGGGLDTAAPTRPSAGPSNASRLTVDAQDILNKIDAGGSMPAFVTNNLRKVAAENGVSVGPDMNAQAVIDALREKQNTTIPPASGFDMSGENVRSTQPPSSADEINALMAAAEQRKGAEARAIAERVASVWDVAEEYWGKGGNYNRGILQDNFALLNALRKPEYGGLPDLTGLNDPRLTPEIVRSALEMRKAAKEAAGAQAYQETWTQPESKGKKYDVTAINEDTSLLRAIALHGGLDLKLAKDLTGEARPKSAPGVFTKKGVGIDEMARSLADDGFPIDINAPDDTGGIRQATELLNRARAGDKVYPMGHDFTKDLSKAEQAYIEAFNFDNIKEIPFDETLWQAEFADTIQRADLTRMYDLIGSFPDEMLDRPSPHGVETWRDYLSRTADETGAKVEDAARDSRVVESVTNAEKAIAEAELRADAATTRNLLKEKFQDVFGLTEEQSQAWMELSDAIGKWYEKATGESGDALYARYYKDVVREVGEGSDQLSVNRLEQEAYHGSPYKFDKFALEHIGEGEGAQTYGWGLYFADNKAVAEWYRKSLKSSLKMSEVDATNPVEIAQYYVDSYSDPIRVLEKDYSDPFYADGKFRKPEVADAMVKAMALLKSGEVKESGQLYKVEIPDENYLLWDKPLSEQPEKVKEKFFVNALPEDYGFKEIVKGLITVVDETGYAIASSSSQEKAAALAIKALNERTGEQLYNSLGAPKAASLALKEAGINGIKYLDALSRGKGNGSFNYVIFDDAAIQVKETFYQRPSTSGLPSAQDGRMPKGAVTFDAEGIKATIHAFEAADFSTLVHENAHVFRTMLADVAERTGNADVKADLATIEKWAGVKDGKWEKVHEEKFARGFERYIAEGKAPTPKLKLAFESFKYWMLEIYKTITGSAIDVKLTKAVREVFDSMVAEDNTRNIGIFSTDLYVNVDEMRAKNAKRNADIKARLDEIQAQKRAGTWNENSLFQEADQPFGAYDAASGFHPISEAMDQGWDQYVKPLMEAMQEGAIKQLDERPLDGAMRDMSPDGQAMLRKYVKGVVNNALPTTKLATMRWGESQRNFALLDYNKRYGIDRPIESVMPYQFYYTRSLVNWAARGLDKPALYSNYARLRMQQDRYERDIPERLRGKIKINAPWMPEWMGGSLYIDPIGNLFFPANVLRPFERAQQDKNYQVVEAERILQEWASDGQYSDSQISQAAKSQSGTIWERALAEAQIRRESELANPLDFFSSFFGPAWYLSTPLNLAGIKVPGLSKGDPNKVTPLPLGNTARALDTVTQGTWAEPVGNVIGLLGKFEDWGRKKLGLPEFGELSDYYIDRELAIIVTEGKYTQEQAQIAMIERKGELFDQARERVKMELAVRVPTMGSLYAALNEGGAAGAQAFLPSLFGSGLLPAGELEYRGLKQEWNEAWAKADQGDTKAVPNFFDEHPEYEAYLAKNKWEKPEERLKSFLIGQIWDGYMSLGETNKKMARAQMGDLFQQSFLDKETRSFDALDVDTLTQWARMLNKMVPQTPPQPSPLTPLPGGEGDSLRLYPAAVTRITDQFFQQRTTYFPNWYEEQQGYYALPKSERAKYLLKTPSLKEYWDWQDKWYKAYPQFEPIFRGKVFKQVDTSTWPPMLESFVSDYAYTGKPLPSGAYKALEQVWIMEGRPMDSMKSWLDSVVAPAMLYQGE